MPSQNVPEVRELSEAEITLRRAMWVPCRSKEALARWVRIYLGVDLPDGHVDILSNSSPMECLWEIYEKALNNQDPTFNRILAYASRISFKTLIAAIMEVLCLVHLDRSVVHLASIVEQSQKAQEYVKLFFGKPFLRDFLVGDASTYTEIYRYVHRRSGDVIPPKEYKALSQAQKLDYEEHRGYIDITSCTMRGTNCVAAGTLVKTQQGLVPVERVRPGDAVLGCDLGTGEDSWFPVGEVSSTVKPAMALGLDTGDGLVVSEDHLLFTRKGWMRARSIRGSARLLSDEVESPAVAPPWEYVQLSEVPASIRDPRSVIIGTLLGDASLVWPKNKDHEPYGRGPRLTLSHSKSQSDLVYVVEAALSMLDVKCSSGWTGGGGFANAQPKKWLSSQTSTFLAELYPLFYRDGKKVLTKEVLDLVDDEALAYWIMDDGCASYEESARGKDKAISLATCCFSDEEHLLAVSSFASRGLSASVKRTGEYPLLSFDMDSSRKISRLVDPYFLPAMKYKLPAPDSMRDTQCLYCGIEMEVVQSPGFPHCQSCRPFIRAIRGVPAGDTDLRKTRYQNLRRALAARCDVHVTSRQFLAPMPLWDLHLDVAHEHQKNFWVYAGKRRYLVHNSKHSPFMVIDEVDVIEGQQVRAYEQAKLIPDGGPKENYKHPITLLISTRKTNFGKVQDEINNAQKTGLILRHWNVLDVSEPCPTSRHRPDLPHVTLYRNEKTLQVLSEEEFKSLDENRQLSFEARDAFAGCRANCQLFGPCEGRLATINTHRTGALKPLSEITTQFRNVGLEMAVAELLCRRPGSEGLIYPSLDETVHLRTAAQLATLITGEHVSEPFEKEQLIHLMLARDMRPVAGVDFGFSHNFSLALGFTDGNRIYVVGAASQAELMPDKQLALAKKHLKPLRNPEVENDFLYSARIYPDTENSQMIAVFKNGGLNCVRWKKGAGSLLAGIEAMRVSMSAVVGHPRLLFLRGDPMVEYFFQRLSAYNWKLDASGKPSDEPNDENDDEADCTRYMVMNVLGKYSGLVVAPDSVAEAVNSVAAVNAHNQLVGMPGKPTPKSTGSVLSPEQTRQENWNRIAELTGIPTIESGEGQNAVAGTLSGDNSKGHRGSFSWSL
jgi:hypothetical protein